MTFGGEKSASVTQENNVVCIRPYQLYIKLLSKPMNYIDTTNI